jgi:hypothetical protein
VMGADGEVGGFTILAEWRAAGIAPPKDRDFALGLGPVVVTLDELTPTGFDWNAAVEFAARGTVLYPGDLLAGPAVASHEIAAGGAAQLEVDGIGVLEQRVAG